MRIGPLTVNINDWHPTKNRTVVNKIVPQYIQPMYFDVVSDAWQLKISGYLIGTSNSDLDSKIQAFNAVCHADKIVWIDASDQYQTQLHFCRILSVDGPHISSENCPYYAEWSLTSAVLLPWGTTLINPWSMSNGIVLRDLSGNSKKYNMLNPLTMNCNFTGSPAGGPFTNFSWEFIIDNQNPFTEVTSVQENNCDSTNNVVNPIDSFGQFSGGYVTDTSNFKEGTGSLKLIAQSPSASAVYAAGYDLGSGINFSNFDRYRMWFRCDQTGQTTYAIIMYDTSNHRREWDFSLQGANIWMNVEVKISAYSVQDTGFSISSVRYLGCFIKTSASPPSTINVWLDDIRVEVGMLNHCEDTSSWSNTTFNSVGYTTITNDSLIFKQSSYPTSTQNPLGITPSAETTPPAAVKMSGTSGGGGGLAGQYNFPVGNWDLTAYDFAIVWARSDFGGNSTGTLQIALGSSGSAYFLWQYANCNANQWYRFVIALRNPGSTTGSPNLNNIQGIEVGSIGVGSATTNLWVDEIALDIGRWTAMEFQIPDNISQTQPSPSNEIQTLAWGGSSYSTIENEDPSGSEQNSGTGYTLDGTTSTQLYSSIQNFGTIFIPGAIGTVQNKSQGNGSSSITYTTSYGCNNRFALSLKLPPATSDSNTGNYPSDDLNGMMAINKVRVKVLIYVSNENTTYEGM
jgi:hypothetical protein